jgi:8-oxo-dGTP diphosphatase
MYTRPCKQLLSGSCHSTGELASTAELRANFVLLSTIFSTPMHPNIYGIGWGKFTDLGSDIPMPVYAFGDLGSNHFETAMYHSAHGIALVG